MINQTRGGSHSIVFGYVFWLFGFMGAHRFYYGKPLTGVLWALTLGLLGIGWIIDLFLIPSMDREADGRFPEGLYNYNIAWILLLLTGPLGIHRMYLDKWISGVIYLLTAGLFGIGWVYDILTFNTQLKEKNLINP